MLFKTRCHFHTQIDVFRISLLLSQLSADDPFKTSQASDDVSCIAAWICTVPAVALDYTATMMSHKSNHFALQSICTAPGDWKLCQGCV